MWEKRLTLSLLLFNVKLDTLTLGFYLFCFSLLLECICFTVLFCSLHLRLYSCFANKFIWSKSDEGRNEDIRGFMEIEKIGSFVCVCLSVNKIWSLHAMEYDLATKNEVLLHSILDEVVFKLLLTPSPVIRGTATKLLLLMTESHQEILILLRLSACCKRLRGLLNKQEPGTEFSQELRQLIGLLSPKAYQEVKDQKQHKAACLIQVYWKGFQTRKRLKKLPSAVITLQRKEEDHRLQLQIQRERVEKHNREIEEKSALIIQKHWKGYREKKNFRQQRPSLTEYKAAVILQRATLKFLAKCRKKKKLFAPWPRLRELTDARRIELKQQVDDYIRRHPGSQISDVTSKELHSQPQERLQHYFMGRALEERAQYIEQLMKAPSLKEAEGKDPELFLSRSRPVAAKANPAPWWKKLGEEAGDDTDVPKDELSVELGTLFIGGTKPP
ncbi:hypothetical protein FD755_006381 [Muntiacus reevesi]|uniref:IQ motif containing B1 n=1 Tax=Muntiacus reevesi TaxID=9886 RepID=A0A5J5MW33_MUNRE|nr:hypothetical protein FD755_006381 [Muntiacus reevesi]